MIEKAHIDRLDISLDWEGSPLDVGKNAINLLGGTVSELNWIRTPPRFVDARMQNSHLVQVRFNEEIKAKDYSAGVRIKINGRDAAITRSFRDVRQHNLVSYEIDTPLGRSESASWQYDSADGFIQNMSGDDVFSVAEKAIKRDGPWSASCIVENCNPLPKSEKVAAAKLRKEPNPNR